MRVALLCVKSGTDRRTDVTTLIVAFYNCCNCVPKKNFGFPTALKHVFELAYKQRLLFSNNSKSVPGICIVDGV